jgi:hypothetical protein
MKIVNIESVRIEMMPENRSTGWWRARASWRSYEHGTLMETTTSFVLSTPNEALTRCVEYLNNHVLNNRPEDT